MMIIGVTALLVDIVLTNQSTPANVETIRATLIGTNVSITATSSRPLSQIAQYLQARLGLAINYEDPAFSRVDAIDVSTSVWRAAHPTEEGVLVPRITQLNLRVPVFLKSMTDAVPVLREAVSSVNESGGQYKFELIQPSPNKFTIAGRSSNQSLAIGDVIIPGAKARSSGAAEFKRVVDECMQRSGYKIVTDRVPWQMLAQLNVEPTRVDESCRLGLINLLSRLPTRVGYSLRYGFESGGYYVLTITPVYKEVVENDGKTHLYKVPKS